MGKKQATDGQFFYDAQGAKRTAKDYRPVMVKELEAAAARLPVRVQGDVSWTVVRLDPAHVRVLLIDPGYLDPADRECET